MRPLAPGNPMLRVLAANLACEAIVFGLAIPAIIFTDAAGVGPAFAAGGVAMVMALVAAGTQRRAWGWWLGWLAQVVAVGLGLLTPWMFAVGGLFAGLHVLAYVLGRRIDAAGARPGHPR